MTLILTHDESQEPCLYYRHCSRIVKNQTNEFQSGCWWSPWTMQVNFWPADAYTYPHKVYCTGYNTARGKLCLNLYILVSLSNPYQNAQPISSLPARHNNMDCEIVDLGGVRGRGILCAANYIGDDMYFLPLTKVLTSTKPCLIAAWGVKPGQAIQRSMTFVQCPLWYRKKITIYFRITLETGRTGNNWTIWCRLGQGRLWVRRIQCRKVNRAVIHPMCNIIKNNHWIGINPLKIF